MKKISLADCFAAALAKRENAETYTGDLRAKDGGARNQSRLVVAASCGLNKSAIHSHDCPDFGRRRFPMYSAVDVFLNRGNIEETGQFTECQKKI
jgi:hypothetical protein